MPTHFDLTNPLTILKIFNNPQIRAQFEASLQAEVVKELVVIIDTPDEINKAVKAGQFIRKDGIAVDQVMKSDGQLINDPARNHTDQANRSLALLSNCGLVAYSSKEALDKAKNNHTLEESIVAAIVFETISRVMLGNNLNTATMTILSVNNDAATYCRDLTHKIVTNLLKENASPKIDEQLTLSTFKDVVRAAVRNENNKMATLANPELQEIVSLLQNARNSYIVQPNHSNLDKIDQLIKEVETLAQSNHSNLNSAEKLAQVSSIVAKINDEFYKQPIVMMKTKHHSSIIDKLVNKIKESISNYKLGRHDYNYPKLLASTLKEIHRLHPATEPVGAKKAVVDEFAAMQNSSALQDNISVSEARQIWPALVEHQLSDKDVHALINTDKTVDKVVDSIIQNRYGMLDLPSTKRLDAMEMTLKDSLSKVRGEAVEVKVKMNEENDYRNINTPKMS